MKWKKKARWVEDGKFITSSGITAGIDAGFAFLANTYLAANDRSSESQKANTDGDATQIPGFNKERALEYARSIAWRLEYRWNDDPDDDPFLGPTQKPA